ncbi:MAG: hypothetical protein J6S69_03545 [Proteobacteria bacterium]|nr:hypothetical protein [Pseudomonadota bacterium]
MVPFNISPESVLHLKELVKRSPEAKPEYGVRLYISGLCGFGPEWSLTLDVYDPALDECCEFDDLKVIVERDLLNAVGGLDVQYEAMDDGEGGGFLITALAPESQALYGGGCGGCGGCGGGCQSGGCGGGCHDGGCGGGCHSGGCGGGCHDGGCNGNCDECGGDCDCCDGCQEE